VLELGDVGLLLAKSLGELSPNIASEICWINRSYGQHPLQTGDRSSDPRRTNTGHPPVPVSRQCQPIRGKECRRRRRRSRGDACVIADWFAGGRRSGLPGAVEPEPCGRRAYCPEPEQPVRRQKHKLGRGLTLGHGPRELDPWPLDAADDRCTDGSPRRRGAHPGISPDDDMTDHISTGLCQAELDRLLVLPEPPSPHPRPCQDGGSCVAAGALSSTPAVRAASAVSRRRPRPASPAGGQGVRRPRGLRPAVNRSRRKRNRITYLSPARSYGGCRPPGHPFLARELRGRGFREPPRIRPQGPECLRVASPRRSPQWPLRRDPGAPKGVAL
jgi:hypothetical protein